MPSIDNVVAMHPKWASKLLCGVKTVEVRKNPPPTHSTGWYGIAVTGVPDAIVGLIKIKEWLSPMTVDRIERRRQETCIPDELLRRYLGADGAGVCWIIEEAIPFENYVSFYSRGQVLKGKPELLGQKHVEEEIVHVPKLSAPSEEQLLRLYSLWKIERRSAAIARKLQRDAIYESLRSRIRENKP